MPSHVSFYGQESEKAFQRLKLGRAFGRGERKDGDAFELPFPVTGKAVTPVRNPTNQVRHFSVLFRA